MTNSVENDVIFTCTVSSSCSSRTENPPVKKGKKSKMMVSPYPTPQPRSSHVPSPLSSHKTPLKHQGNHHQQSSNGRTVGVPIRPNHKVSDLIVILGR